MTAPEDGAALARAYDPESPVVRLMEERLLRAFEKGQAESRHMMRGEVAELAVTVANAQRQATEEHAKVQVQLVEMRADIVELRPLKQTVAELQAQEYAEKASTAATENLRRSMWRAAASLAALIIAAAGVMVAIFS